ncbi:MAG TPA: energy-coupling factor transporter transmembrane component T [Anaerolineae bacterium]
MLPIISGATSGSRPDALYPATKVLWLGAVCTVALATHRPAVLVAALGLLWVTSLAAGLPARGMWQVIRLSLPFCLALLVLQLLFRHDGLPLVRLAGLTIYRGALPVALLSVLRVLCLALAGSQFWSWTHPTDLALMLSGWGVPYRYAFLPTLAFRAFPLLSHELAAVLEGQQLLGIDMQRAWDQITHFPQLFIPFCTTTLGAGNDMALALELRGYGSQARRTHLRTLTVNWWDCAAGAICLAVIVCALVVPGF